MELQEHHKILSKENYKMNIISHLKRYIREPKKIFSDKRNGVQIHYKTNTQFSDFEGNNRIHQGVFLAHSVVGYGTYVGSSCYLPRCKIGKYSCIAPNTNLVIGNHPTDTFLSIHPCFYSSRKQAGFTYTNENKFEEFKYIDTEKKFYVEIGSDVWIGSHTLIVNGIKIGNGAVIACGSIVTKNVEDYAIMGGSPAKVIRYRFDPETINIIKTLRWWDKPEEWIRKNLDIFTEDLSYEKLLKIYDADCVQAT